ncbi:MAG: prephenate dehydratase [Mucinivorans sp.]
MKIAIQGQKGSFHYAVAEHYFGAEAQIVCLDTFVAEAHALLDHRVDAAVIAIENSIAGSILPNYHILQNRELKVVGEYFLQIEQCLMALPGVALEEINTVSSHPIALLQCEAYLDAHPLWRRIQSEDTALSAQQVQQEQLHTTAAIASQTSAELYGLNILARGINTIKNNYTRFLIVSRAERTDFDTTEPDKASMFFKVPHQSGSLGKILRIIELYDLNMSKLQSYPIPEDPFRYNFHLDVEFSSRASFEAASALIDRHTEEFAVYGIYKNGNKL